VAAAVEALVIEPAVLKAADALVALDAAPRILALTERARYAADAAVAARPADGDADGLARVAHAALGRILHEPIQKLRRGQELCENESAAIADAVGHAIRFEMADEIL
jgi:hypothetical protein